MKFTPSSETAKQEVLEYAIKELSDDSLINELKSRGYQTVLLFNLTDIDMQISKMNEDIDTDEESPIILDDLEKENILDEVFDNVDNYIEGINFDIQNKINEQNK